MELVAWRESRDEPQVVNGPYVGLFQINYSPPYRDSTGAWHPPGGTWAGVNVVVAGKSRYLRNPYINHSPFSARYSALTAAWLWWHGQQYAWSTYP